METSLKLGLLILVILSACNEKDSYKPDRYFGKQQQIGIIRQAVYYSTKLAPHATHETKFNAEFDWYYDAYASDYDWRLCSIDKEADSSYYFLMTRKAKSIWPAREAIGGKFKRENKKLVDYEEIFRTWKMTEDTLNARAYELFDLMVRGKDLEPYRSKYKGDRYIEFPDDRSYFDKQKKHWSYNMVDSLN